MGRECALVWCFDDSAKGTQRGAPDQVWGGPSEHFLQIKTGQAAPRLLSGHCLRNFGSDLLKSTLSIKPISCFLNLGSAHNHLCEPERTRFCLCTVKHTLRDA